MCGRYTLYKPDELATRYRIDDAGSKRLLKELKARYNIAPTQEAAVIVEDEESSKPRVEVMRWGFMPPWSKDEKSVFKYSTFNARSEGIFEKNLWKSAIKHHRCIIPSNGFYEWQKRSDGKQPFLIKPKGEETFSFAGIYGEWTDAEGKKHNTYSIITTSPNDQMQPIHNRMPVILHPADETIWLDPDNDEQEILIELMRPFEDGSLELFEVSKEVNAARSDDAAYIKPLNSK